MFHLFGKKKEDPPVQEKKSAAPLPHGFDGDEVTVIAVTGPGSFARRQDEQGQDYSALELTAWMEEDGAEIHRGSYELAIPQDEELLDYLRTHVPRDFIIKFTARLNGQEDKLLLISLPAPGFDPDLKAILDQQKAPVLRAADGLGEFALNRSAGWFQLDAPWGENTVQLLMDQGSEEEMAAAEAAARTLLSDVPARDSAWRAFAAQRLPDACPDAPELDGLDEAAIAGRLEAESLQVWADGRFECWMHDADYEWPRSVRLTGTVQDGPQEVYLEG